MQGCAEVLAAFEGAALYYPNGANDTMDSFTLQLSPTIVLHVNYGVANCAVYEIYGVHLAKEEGCRLHHAKCCIHLYAPIFPTALPPSLSSPDGIGVDPTLGTTVISFFKLCLLLSALFSLHLA